LIWINKTVHMPILRKLENLPPIIVDQIAAEPTVWENLASNDPRWYARWFFKQNGRRVIRYDESVYGELAGIVSISEEDQRVTKQWYPHAKTVVVPMGIDPHYYRPSAQSPPDNDLLLFSGTDAVRNVDAIDFFAQNIYPHLGREAANLRVLWIGNVKANNHRVFRNSWISTTGFVDHTPPWFSGGAIFIAPFRMGEGMKTKIIEAWAMEKVVVSTSVGMRGIDVRDLPFVRVCDQADEFAQAILDFRSNPQLSALGAEARRYAVERFSWPRVVQPARELIGQAIAH
jgi:glycosyltransferase involved in cell wall biosynthesis